MSLNGALATASRSLDLFTLGIQVHGNNIANASSPGYIRETLTTSPSMPYKYAGVLIGSGALADGVRQQVDRFLEKRIYVANSDFSAADARNAAHTQLQTTLQELGDSDLSTSLNEFVNSVQTVVNQPDDPALRSVVIQQGQQFAIDVRNIRLRIDELRQSASDKMSSLVTEANQLIATIANLNPKIGQLEANGLGRNDAGGLRVQRYNALQRLSEIIPTRVQELPSGAVDVFTGSDYLVLAGNVQQLTAVVAPTNDGVTEVHVQLERTKSLLNTSGGELGGLVEARDKILSGFVDQLDRFVGAVAFEFNKIHAGGEGLIGLTDVTSDFSADDTSVALNVAGLKFTPDHGQFRIKIRNTGTGAETVSQIPVDLDGIGTDSSLEDIRAALDGIDHLTATITSDRRLRLTSDAGYEIRFGEDTSGFLAALGINSFFTGSNSGDLGVSSRIRNDQRFFASGRGAGPADNRNAIALAGFIDRPVKNLGGLTVDDFYTNLIATSAQSASAEDALTEGFGSFRESLLTQREQYSGVSLDEETIKIMNLQTNYRAAARIVSTIDELMNTLLNM